MVHPADVHLSTAQLAIGKAKNLIAGCPEDRPQDRGKADLTDQEWASAREFVGDCTISDETRLRALLNLLLRGRRKAGYNACWAVKYRAAGKKP